MEGIRPEVDLGEQGVKQILESNGTWSPAKTVPLPTKKPGTVIMKGRRKMSEKLIEQGRKGNKGCYVVSWVVSRETIGYCLLMPIISRCFT